MHLINKLFNNETIRTVWDKEQEKYYVSVVDVVGVLSGSDRPRKYWSDLKRKLIQEGNEVSEKIGQLKLKSKDGKYRTTDICDIEEMFRIIESIPSKNAEPIKQWLAKLEVKELMKYLILHLLYKELLILIKKRISRRMDNKKN